MTEHNEWDGNRHWILQYLKQALYPRIYALAGDYLKIKGHKPTPTPLETTQAAQRLLWACQEHIRRGLESTDKYEGEKQTLDAARKLIDANSDYLQSLVGTAQANEMLWALQQMSDDWGRYHDLLAGRRVNTALYSCVRRAFKGTEAPSGNQVLALWEILAEAGKAAAEQGVMDASEARRLIGAKPNERNARKFMRG